MGGALPAPSAAFIGYYYISNTKIAIIFAFDVAPGSADGRRQ